MPNEKPHALSDCQGGTVSGILDSKTLTRLLGSIEADRLVLLCGAGLSIPMPSHLMTAVQVARMCYDKYAPTHKLPVAMRDRIDDLAGHFYANHEFEGLFINTLVPWNELVGEPNKGHAAVSDFLICRAVHAALSANFDPLIEQWANSRKIALQGALDGQEAIDFRKHTNPLIKFHGCMERGRNETLWTDAQLNDAKIAARVKTCSEWMKLELPGKDLLVIGFWTDWGYLNDVLAEALSKMKFGFVIVIDPQESDALKAKAPELWQTLSSGSDAFFHVRASGADVLEELRVAYSRTWMKKFYALAGPLLADAGMKETAIDLEQDADVLYDCRRDSEGTPYNRAASMKEPAAAAAQTSFFHFLLLEAGATRDGSWFNHKGKRIRVIHGAGQGLNSVRERYVEPPATKEPEFVVCVGAIDLAVPARIVSSGVGPNIVRPGAAAGPKWMTFDQARGVLGL